MMVAMAGDGFESRAGSALALWHDTTRRLALVIFPLVVFLVAMASQVITVLFTRQYLASVPVFQLWTCVLVLAVPCVDAVLRARAQTRFLLGLNLLRLALVVGLIGWWLDAFGLPGAVLAMLAATAVTRVIALVRIARVMSVRIAAVLPWRSLATTAACAVTAGVPAVWSANVVAMPPIASLAIGAAVYGLVYAGLCLRVIGGGAPAPVVATLQTSRLM
jgi:O-antigen/teichoic acid export membrane protein